MPGGASGKALVHVLAESRCGQGDDGDRRQSVERFPFADGAGGRQSVHDWHLEIHQDQVKRLQQELGHRNFAVLGLDDTMGRMLEEGLHQHPVVGRVFGQQDV
jgi:hypothetical protein